MHELTVDQLAQRILDCRLLEARDIDRAISAAGGRHLPYEALQDVLLREELLTNWQLQRLVEGQRKGYFYGNWKVLYLVGAGTFARVYRGCHTKTADIKAIKVLRSRYSEDSETQHGFLREGKMVMRLRHPNIVPIYEVEEDRGRTYMVMDFIEGQNLRDYVKAHKRLNYKTALSITRDLADGLAYAYELGICHRDMKLSNVLLSTKGQAKLVDFGLAAVTSDDGKSDENFNPRSIDYAGLEKITGVLRDDKRSDIYFLGCMLYHMLSGQPALSEIRDRTTRMSARRFQEVVPITSLQPGLPHRAVILTHRLMELDPEKRPQTPKEALAEIEATIDAIESGDIEKYDSKLAQQHADAFQKNLDKDQVEGAGKTVMLIESNVKVQDLLREKLKELGYKVLIFGDPQRAIRRCQDSGAADDKPCDVVIFGSTGLGRVAVEAFDYFCKQKDLTQFPAILLIKPEWQPLLAGFQFDESKIVLDLPLKFKHVRSAIQKLTQQSSTSSP